MDEIDAICPGECLFELVPDIKLNEKNNTDCYYKPKNKFDTELPEHIMATEYSNALKQSMEEAMRETFDIVNSEVPAASSVATSLFWVH